MFRAVRCGAVPGETPHINSRSKTEERTDELSE
jgi:hypothetical protein